MSGATAEEKLTSLGKGQSNQGTVDTIAQTGHTVALAATAAVVVQQGAAAYAVGGMASVGCFAAPLVVGAAGAMIGASVAQAVGADDWLASKIGGPRIASSSPHPATITHPIAHSHKFAGALGGLLIGALVAAAVVATVATGGLALGLIVAAGAGLAGGFAGAMIAGAGAKMGTVTGNIQGPGSPNVFFNGKPAARVTDGCTCSKCKGAPPQIAEGSTTVFINGLPMARVGHKTTCGAVVQDGCATIFSDATTGAYGPVDSEVSVLEQVVLSVAEVGLSLSAVKFRNSKLGKQVFGEPIEPISGDYVDRRVDLDYPGILPLQLVRTYAGKDAVEGALGSRWLCNWSQRLTFGKAETGGEGTALLEDGDGDQLLFALGFAPEFSARHLKAPHYYLSGSQAQARLFDSRSQQTLIFEPEAENSDISRLTAIEDRNGNRIAFHYEGRALRRVTHSDGALFYVASTEEDLILSVTREGEDTPQVRYAYGPQDELLEVRSLSGGEFHYGYSPEGWLNHWHDTGPTSVDLDYDTAGRVIATRTPHGLYNDRLEYFPEERRSVYIDALGARTTLWFDERDCLLKMEDPLGRTTEYAYDGFERRASATDPLGRVTRFEYETLGRLASVTDPFGRTTAYRYDRTGLLTQVQHPDGSTSAWTYDERGNLLEAEAPGGATTRYTYDGAGRLLTVTRPDGAEERLEYDPAGRLKGWRDPLGQATAFEVDAWGRMRQVTDAEGHSTRYRYDSARGLLSSIHAPDGGVQRFEYDREGQLATRTGAEGQTTRYQHGAFDLLQSITDAEGHTTRLHYDGAARLTRLTNAAGREWLYTYDLAGQVEAETDWAGRRTRYFRDALGRVTRKILPGGVEQRLTWDDRDRIAEVWAPSGRIAYEYDEVDRLVNAATFGASGEPETELRYVYNEQGQLTEEIQNGVALQYAYDKSGRCISRKSPSGETSWRFDLTGGLTEYQSNGHSLSFTRNTLGQEISRSAGPNAFTLRQQYDPCGRLSHQSAGRSRGQVEFLPDSHRTSPALEAQGEIRRFFEWDRSGRLVGVRDSERGQRSFTYDPRNQVRLVKHEQYHREERYGYNALMDLVNSDGRRHQYQSGEVQQIGNTSYRYDKRGRVISKTAIDQGFRPQTWAYHWDDFDRMSEVETPEGERWRYIYDAFGRRAQKKCLTPGKGSTVRFLWQGATQVEEIREGNPREAAKTYRWHFEPGSFRPIAKEVHSEEDCGFYPIVTDHLGTPKELFDESGERLWQADHKLWGKAFTQVLRLKGSIKWKSDGTREVHTTTDCNLRFPNQWEDEETGLHYNLNRYYDPESGQYLSQDPIRLAGGLRTHGYVHDPMAWVDPMGLAGCPKPAEQAAAWQGHGDYPGVDNWKNVTLKKGTIVYGGTPGQTEFYTTKTAFERGAKTQTSVWERLQVKPNPKYGYRPEMTAYEVVEDVPAARATTLANPQFGEGGDSQLFIPDYQAKLQPLYKVELPK